MRIMDNPFPPTDFRSARIPIPTRQSVPCCQGKVTVRRAKAVVKIEVQTDHRARYAPLAWTGADHFPTLTGWRTRHQGGRLAQRTQGLARLTHELVLRLRPQEPKAIIRKDSKTPADTRNFSDMVFGNAEYVE